MKVQKFKSYVVKNIKNINKKHSIKVLMDFLRANSDSVDMIHFESYLSKI